MHRLTLNLQLLPMISN